MGEVKLFRTWSSPYALRIVWALKLKGIEYETIYEDTTNKSPLLLQYNPVHKKVPVLVHNGKPICESLIILEYIDETWKEAGMISLLPEDPFERAAARFWAKFNDEKVLSTVFLAYISEGKEQEEAKGAALENLKLIEEQLKGKKFFGGETFGFLDLAFGWMAIYLGILEEGSSQTLVDEETFPLISAWKENFADIPEIKESAPDREKLIVKLQAMREAHNAAK